MEPQHGSEPASGPPTPQVAEEIGQGIGAYIMGRNMFGPDRGPWDLEWRGWWGEDPPYHTPVYVLCHHEREPLPMEGGTTFHFVTDGIEPRSSRPARRPATSTSRSRAARARCASSCAPGCSTSSTCTSSRSCWARASGSSRTSATRRFEPVKVVDSPAVTHVKYRVVH